MVETKEMHPGGYYVFHGSSTARDLFFENDQDIVDFKAFFERMLGGYLQVYRMLLYKDQWYIAVKLNGEGQIIKQYLLDRDKSRKANREYDFDLAWRIISERVRVFLCNFVLKTNNRKDRKGGKVSASYKRYYFTSLEEMQEELDNWEKRAVSPSQRSRKYVYLEKYYEVNEKEKGMGMLVFCKKEDVEEFCGRNSHKMWSLMKESIDVVRQWIEVTINIHLEPG